jgi:hypothetical protein
MKRLYLLGSAAIIGLTLLGGAPSYAHGGGHGHAGGTHHSAAHHAASHHSAAHHAAPHQSAHTHTTHAHAAGHHSTSSHGYTHSGHSWHHHGGANGYWGGLGGGFVAPGIVAPWYYDQFWNAGPNTLVAPGVGEIVTREYLNNVTSPVAPFPAPAGPIEFSPTRPDDVP